MHTLNRHSTHTHTHMHTRHTRTRSCKHTHTEPLLTFLEVDLSCVPLPTTYLQEKGIIHIYIYIYIRINKSTGKLNGIIKQLLKRRIAYVWVVPSSVPGAILSSFSSSTLNTQEIRNQFRIQQYALNIRYKLHESNFSNRSTHLIQRSVRFFSLLLTQVNYIRCFNTSRSTEGKVSKKKKT